MEAVRKNMNGVAPVKSVPGLRWYAVLIFVAIVGLAAVITFTRSPAAEAEAARFFSPRLIEENLQYALERRLLFWANTLLELAVLLLLVCTPLARCLADGCARLCRGWWLP